MSNDVDNTSNHPIVHDEAGRAKLRPDFLILYLIAVAAGAVVFYYFAERYFAVYLVGMGVMTVILSLGIVAGRSKKRVRIILRVIAVILSLAALFSLAVYRYAPSQMFYPNFDEQSYLALTQETDAIAVEISTKQGSLSGWFLENVDEPAPLILYFGGNGENASTRILTLCRSKETRAIFEGYNFVFIDYPKYGQSEGELSESGIKQYSIDVYDYFAEDADVTDIIPMGYSLGTGLANYVASKRDVAGLILMAPYADFFDMYNDAINIFYGPMRLLVAIRMESVVFAKDISVSPLVFASLGDEAIPYKTSERLVRAYPVAPEFVTLQDLRHNDFWDEEVVLAGIETYLKTILDGQG